MSFTISVLRELSSDFSLVIIRVYVLTVPSSAVTVITLLEGFSVNKFIFLTYTLLFPILARLFPSAVAVSNTFVTSFGRVNV